MEENHLEKTKRGVDRNLIKYIAMLTMFLNHFAHMFLVRGTVSYRICTYVGYFTAITMCYFLVEGFRYTRSRKKYACRLLIFAIIAQVPFSLAFDAYMGNMLFTLLFCFCILCLLERRRAKWWATPLIVLLFLVCTFCDWLFLAPLFTVMFAWAYGNRKRMWIAYGVNIATNFVMQAINFSMAKPPLGLPNVLLESAYASLALVASAAVIQFLYGGEKPRLAPSFSKWFFYVFYPGHILALLAIKALC